MGERVVVTEKLDGGNTLLHAGKVYARSVLVPSEGPWMAMVKKHHAWKVNEPDVWIYGEDIYGVHSIEYGPVREHRNLPCLRAPGRDGCLCVLRGGRGVREGARHPCRAGLVQR